MFNPISAAARIAAILFLCAAVGINAIHAQQADPPPVRIDPEHGEMTLLTGERLAAFFAESFRNFDRFGFEPRGTFCFPAFVEECGGYELRQDRVVLLPIPGSGRFSSERILFVYSNDVGVYAHWEVNPADVRAFRRD